MKWTETKVIFDYYDKSFAADLISDIFYNLDVKGVVIEGPETDPAADNDWADGVQKMPEKDAVIAYFPDNMESREKYKILEKELIRLNNDNGIITQILYNKIDEEDWAESWKNYFFPEKISRRIVVKPTWREYSPAPHEIVLEIDPGMAFGTGTHPTTILCVNMIEAYLKPGYTLLDVGTGSGILMIAGAKLGAAKMLGVDTDEIAVDIAQKNLLLNSIEDNKFKVIKGNLLDNIKEEFDIVVANILSNVILLLLDHIRKVLKKGGLFICSGIIEENKDTVAQKMKDSGFDILEIQTDQHWVCIAGKLKKTSEVLETSEVSRYIYERKE